MKEEKKHHGAVDKSSSEQQFHKSNEITLLCKKSGAILLVLVGLMAGWQSEQILVDFKKFKILYGSHQ